MRVSVRSRSLYLSVSLLALTSATPAFAEGGGRAIALDTVTVTATKTEDAPVDALAAVSVVNRDDLEQIEADRVADLLEAVPGVTVVESGNNPSSAINIRGLQDFGRVAVMIDGARQNFQQTGHGANGIFFLEPELLEQTSVIRGPIANVYGSGAIGGVVNFTTRDADSFLRPHETWGVSGVTQYGTNGDSLLNSATAAGRVSDAFSVLGSVVYRTRGNYEDGAGNTVFNSGHDILTGLVKATVRPADGHKITASFLGNHTDYTTGEAAATQYDTDVYATTARLGYEFKSPDNPLIDFRSQAYWTATDVDQTYASGLSAGSERSFRIDTTGFDVSNTSRFNTGFLDHALTVGGDLFHDKVETEDTAGSGSLYTPSGERTAYGAFVQDQITVGNWLEVIPAVRFDAYELSGGGTEADGERASPKITVGLSPFENTALNGFKVYGTYAEGYRAPAITETLMSGVHPGAFSFNFLPNPDLKPETAHNVEAGINYKRSGLFTETDRLLIKANVFQNEIDDYIDAVFAFNPVTFGFDYQYQNVANARIRGVEVEANYDARSWFVGLAGHVIRGDNLDTNQPLATVAPDKLVSTLGFRFLDEKLTIAGQWSAVAAQDRVPAGTPTSGSYNLVNLSAAYEPRDGLQLGMSVENLLNEEYTSYLDSDAAEGMTVKFTLRARLGG